MGVFLPEIPKLEFVTDDSPLCHQSLKYWGPKTNEVLYKNYIILLMRNQNNHYDYVANHLDWKYYS